MASILIAESAPALNRQIAGDLRLAGHQCDQAFTGEQALALAAGGRYDLVLLDAGLSGTVLSRLPEEQPVAVLTGGQSRAEQSGRSAVPVEPYSPQQLLTRVEAALEQTGQSTRVFAFRDLTVDFQARQVRRGGRPVNLTPQEFSLLEALVSHRNLAMSRERLLALAWGYDYQGETRTVDVHIQRLRRKLGLEQQIQTVFKVGYRLNTRD